jgi:HNH endonuclease
VTRATKPFIIRKGYAQVLAHGHPRADRHGYVPEHLVIAERALGRFIELPILVHHHNGIRADNRGPNLVICPDEAYHQLLHMRQRALTACGHPHWRKCVYCGSYDAPDQMQVHAQGRKTQQYHHRECARSHRARWRRCA